MKNGYLYLSNFKVQTRFETMVTQEEKTLTHEIKTKENYTKVRDQNRYDQKKVMININFRTKKKVVEKGIQRFGLWVQSNQSQPKVFGDSFQLTSHCFQCEMVKLREFRSQQTTTHAIWGLELFIRVGCFCLSLSQILLIIVGTWEFP